MLQAFICSLISSAGQSYVIAEACYRFSFTEQRQRRQSTHARKNNVRAFSKPGYLSF